MVKQNPLSKPVFQNNYAKTAMKHLKAVNTLTARHVKSTVVTAEHVPLLQQLAYSTAPLVGAFLTIACVLTSLYRC